MNFSVSYQVNALRCPSPRNLSRSWCHGPDQSHISWPFCGRSTARFWPPHLCGCTVCTQHTNTHTHVQQTQRVSLRLAISFPQHKSLCLQYIKAAAALNDDEYFCFCSRCFCCWVFKLKSLTFLAARKSRPWATSKENLSRSSMSSGQSTVSSHSVSSKEKHRDNMKVTKIYFLYNHADE